MLIAAALNFWIVPSIPATDKTTKIDWLGITLLGFGSASLIYGLSRAGKLATFNNSDTWLFASIGLFALFIYVIWGIYKKKTAVLPLVLFKAPVYAASTVNLFLAGIITTGPMLILPLYFQQGRGLSILQTGFWLLPQGIGMLLIRPLLLKLLDRIGARYVVWLSLSLSILGTMPFGWIDSKTNILVISVVLFIRGLGIGGIIMPLMTTILMGMDKKLMPQANIGARIFQNLGGAFGSALVATIISSYLSTHHTSLANIIAYQHAFWWSVLLTGLMIIPSIFLPKYVEK